VGTDDQLGMAHQRAFAGQLPDDRDRLRIAQRPDPRLFLPLPLYQASQLAAMIMLSVGAGQAGAGPI
jgi:hypothetical protein